MIAGLSPLNSVAHKVLPNRDPVFGNSRLVKYNESHRERRPVRLSPTSTTLPILEEFVVATNFTSK